MDINCNQQEYNLKDQQGCKKTLAVGLIIVFVQKYVICWNLISRTKDWEIPEQNTRNWSMTVHLRMKWPSQTDLTLYKIPINPWMKLLRSNIFSRTNFKFPDAFERWRGLTLSVIYSPSINTMTESLRIGIVVQMTRIEKTNVQAGSTNFHSGCKISRQKLWWKRRSHRTVYRLCELWTNP